MITMFIFTSQNLQNKSSVYHKSIRRSPDFSKGWIAQRWDYDILKSGLPGVDEILKIDK